jgi:hypothetical protein
VHQIAQGHAGLHLAFKTTGSLQNSVRAERLGGRPERDRRRV